MHIISGYQIYEHLYESANSLVYRAHRQTDQSPVILKVLKEAYPSPERIAWFKREYEVTLNLHMEGVPRVYALETAQNRWLMVLEDFGGDSLSRLRLAARLSLREFLHLAIRVTDILGQIHQHNIMHKDLNPANIVYKPTTGQVKIIDFGISTVLSREKPAFRNPNVLEGTLAYMSPEQTGRMNRAMDYRTDFYSLGATFYELLTGRLPFFSDDALELVHQHIARHPVPPHEQDPDIPAALSSIILKLMSKNAEDRYQSAYGLKADLQHILSALEQVGGTVDELLSTSVGQVAEQEEDEGGTEDAVDVAQLNELLAMFFPGQHDIPDRFLIPQKLYGRGNEVATLLEAFEQVSAGASKVILVTGEAGIGKTALVQELYKPITRQRGYFISGKFDQFHRNNPYAALIQAFRSLMRHLLTETEAAIAEWRRKLLGALGANGQVIIEVIAEVELIIGKQPAVPVLEPSQAQNRFNLVFQQFMQVFTQPEHPLVLFLDDLQWADGASLKLLEQVMTASDSRYLLLIGTYRTNGDSHAAFPLQRMLQTIEHANVRVQRLVLEPLPVSAVTRMVVETLYCEEDYARLLAEVVVMKTGGNPFFLQEFLTSLYVETLIDFDYTRGRWRWSQAAIQSQKITDNVVDLMTKKVQRLPLTTQNVLKLAACIGTEFDLIKLAVVSQKPVSQAAHDLEQAIMEGVVVPLGDTYKLMTMDVPGLVDAVTAEYAFSHGRIQQAAYSLIPENERQEVHWRIGTLLLLDIPPEQREEYIFDVVNQLNHGQAFITEPSEKIELAQLNLLAGQKAKASAAFEPALKYLRVGISLLDEQSWQNQHALTLELHGEAAEAAYLNGSFVEMEQLIELVSRHVTDVLDSIKVYEIKIRAAIAQGKHVEAVQIALRVLEALGIPFRETPDQSDVLAGLQETRSTLAKRSFEDLLHLPEMIDKYKLAAMRILTSTINAAYVANPELMTLITFKMVTLSVTYGYTPISAHAYASYALILCGDIGDIDMGYRYGQLAQQLLDRFDARELKPRTLMVINNFVRHWKEHARETIYPLIETYQLGMEVGDLEFAALALYVSSTLSFFTGSQLDQLEAEMRQHDEVLKRIRQSRALYMNGLYRQVVLNLMGKSSDPCALMGERFQEETMVPLHRASNDKTAMYYVYFNKLILSYLFHQYAEAVDYAAMAETYAASAVGSFSLTLLSFYDSLARLALVSNLRMQRKKPGVFERVTGPHHMSSITRHLEKVASNQKKMKQWAQHAPMNHLHKWYLVEAERANVLGNDRDARDYFDRAIDMAREYGYINEEALACELAAGFYASRKRTRIASIYLQDAHYAYHQWGASTKVQDLEAQYAQIMNKEMSPSVEKVRITSSINQTDGRFSSTLDVFSIIKASQAIFGEIVLEPLLTKLMHVFIENAGAQRGMLLLQKGGKWVIEAEQEIDSDEMLVLQCLPMTSDTIPSTIIHYVSRMRESIVLRDARQGHAFVQDYYIQAFQPQSILCMPLVYEGELIGILYLENNLATGAFTEERVEMLNVLTSQAAISIVHANLYRHMEYLVEARTAALSAANEALQAEVQERKRMEQVLQKAKDAAEAANRAKSVFLASMSHELRTPLNAILGFAQIMQRSKTLPAEFQENVKIIHRSGEHLLALINSVLDLSKIEAGRMTLNSHSFDLNRMLDDLYSMFLLRAQDKRLLLTFHRTPDVPRYVQADEVRLRQILTNLLSNALKFTRQGSVAVRVKTLPVSLPMEQTMLRFEVEDSGPGMAEDELAVLFDAFVQTKAGLQAQEGTGLGLAISQKFAQMMGGSLDVRSVPGQGSVFTCDIPFAVVKEEVYGMKQHVPRVVGLKPVQPVHRLLVVDDQSDNRQLLVALLSALGFELREACNGQEALEIWQEWQPELIWMDMRMPVMDGYEAARRIKASVGGDATKVIALTASAFEDERSTALMAGCDDFVRKPFHEEDILAILQKYIHVEYVYDEEASAGRQDGSGLDVAEGNEQSFMQEWTVQNLESLPVSWVSEVYHAATLGEIHILLRLVEQVRECAPRVAAALKYLANNFRFDYITEACLPLVEGTTRR